MTAARAGEPPHRGQGRGAGVQRRLRLPSRRGAAQAAHPQPDPGPARPHGPAPPLPRGPGRHQLPALALHQPLRRRMSDRPLPPTSRPGPLLAGPLTYVFRIARVRRLGARRPPPTPGRRRGCGSRGEDCVARRVGYP